MNRLISTLELLSIPFSVDPIRLAGIAKRLLAENELGEAILRIHVTRGTGQRGYSTLGSRTPSLIMSLHRLPEGIGIDTPSWTLQTSTLIIQRDAPLNAHKSTNKLLQILAKKEADLAQVDDVLLLTQDGFVSETSSANVFWIDGETVKTPPESAGILPGITRQVILEICETKGMAHAEELVEGDHLAKMNGVFLSQSVWEIIPIASIDGHQLQACKEIHQLQEALRARALKSPFPQ